MLTNKDIKWIKESRKEIMKNRTETVEVVFESGSEKDPYTGEEIGGTETKDVEVRWLETNDNQSNSGFEVKIKEGYKVVEGDAEVTFPYDIDPYKIKKIIRNGMDYKVITIDERGLGEYNRYECKLKRVK